RPRPARGHRRNPTRPASTTRGSDRPDLQRDPTPVHRTDHQTHPPAHQPTRLVTLATPPPTPSPRLPLPPPTNSAHMITIYDWSTREPAGDKGLLASDQRTSRPSWAEAMPIITVEANGALSPLSQRQ